MKLRIISGGQTGVDRGALDAALEWGLEHGGYCPKGRLAEDGKIPTRYKMEEIDRDSYPARTAMNIQNADATLILVWGKDALKKSRGSMLTFNLCLKNKTAWWIADPRKDSHVGKVVNWLRQIQPLTLNVAGHRESQAPGIQDQTRRFLSCIFRSLH